MNPIFLMIAAGGIVLIVLLHLMMGNAKQRELPGDEELLKRFQEAMGETPREWLCTQTQAIAIDPKDELLCVLFVHGFHINLRTYPLESVVDCRVETGTPGHFLLRVRSFDRGLFRSALQPDQEDEALAFCTQVRQRARIPEGPANRPQQTQTTGTA